MGEEHYAAVVRLCLQLLGNVEDAEDAAQETFRRALKQDMSVLGDPLRWLRTVARNVCIDELRRRRDGSAQPPLQAAAPAGDEPERVVVGRAFVDELLGRLTPAERRVVEARVVEDRSGPELAATLGVAPSTARVLLARGLGKLRRYLADSQAGLGGVASGAWRVVRQMWRALLERIRWLAGSSTEGPGLVQGLAALLGAAIATLCLCLPGAGAHGQAAPRGQSRVLALAPASMQRGPVGARASAPSRAGGADTPLPAPASRRSGGGTAPPPPRPFRPTDLIPQGSFVQSPSSPGQGIHVVGPVYLEIAPGPGFTQLCGYVPDGVVEVHVGPSDPRCRVLPGAL